MTDQVVNSVSIDAGKVVWTEGAAADTPEALFEYQDGVTTEVATESARIIGVDADDGYLVWTNVQGFPEPNVVMLAEPKTVEPSDDINLGDENQSTFVTLDQDRSLVATEFNYQGWTPATLRFGFTSEDGLPLDGIVVVDESGQSHPLSSYWTVITQPFTGEPVKLVIPAEAERKVRVIWWGMGY